MNYNIIDGNDDYLELVPEFTELYNNKKIKVNSIKKRLGLSKNMYNKLLKYCKEENLITPRRKPNKRRETYKTNPKNYSQISNGKYISFAVRKNGVHYCNCKTAREAEQIVEKLRECNWDKSQLSRIRAEVK